jgi:hypothetical protein
MNIKQWQRHFKKHPHKDLNGRYVAYDIDGTPLGEVVYKEGVLVPRKRIRKRKKRGLHGNTGIGKQTRADK